MLGVTEMTRGQKNGVKTVLGGLTASIALLTGLPEICADELADLRAMQTNLRDNQELLQQRIDQLAQTAPKLMRPGEPGPSGMPTLGGSFPRSFLIPGTDTSIRVGGFADLTMDYWFKGGPANGNVTTTVGSTGQLQVVPLNIHGQTVPGFPSPGNVVPANVQASRGHVFSMSPRESRLNVETRTPTSYGEARTFIEIDFAGANAFSTQNLTQVSNGLVPRLRFAYGTLGGFLAGQAESNFRDSDADSANPLYGKWAPGHRLVRVAGVSANGGDHAGRFGDDRLQYRRLAVWARSSDQSNDDRVRRQWRDYINHHRLYLVR
jgi:hypothetical protein